MPENENLSLDIDPKSQWALRNLDKFPIEVNTASYEALLRTPGIGVKNAYRITLARKYAVLKHEDLKRLRVNMHKASLFVTANGVFTGPGDKPELILTRLKKTDLLPSGQGAASGYTQTSIFDSEL